MTPLRHFATAALALFACGSSLQQIRPATPRCLARGALPDSVCTPGAIGTTDRATICGQSTRERRRVTEEDKREAFEAYGVPLADRSYYEIDHLVPLELGGSNRASNLWPEPEGVLLGYRQKDRVENYLHREVCAGRMTLESAQRAIATDWVAVYRSIEKDGE
jgi:hypothetical protein